MTKNEFKQGDRVRFTGDYDHYVESTLEKGEEYAVTYVDSVGNCDLSVPCTAYSINAEDLELVEDAPYDRQEDFLTRLQALLREFNAEIGYSPENAIIAKIDKHAYNPIELWWDMPSKKWAITADNIMDFDKE